MDEVLLVGPDSPLRSLPSALNRRQTMFLDGIRYSLDMGALAYSALVESLLQVSVSGQEEGDERLPSALYPWCFMNAWSFVDSINRLRLLFDHMPNVKNTARLVAFKKRLEPFENLRNSVQHLPGEIIMHAEAGEPVWGSLSWAYWPAPPEGNLFMHVMTAGSAKQMKERPAVNPLGRDFRACIDHVELTAFGRTVSLASMYWRLGSFVRGMEEAIGPQFEGLDRAGADLIVTIEAEAREAGR